MRYLRQVLETVGPQSEEGENDSIVVSTRENLSEACWNVFFVSDEDEILPPSNNVKYSHSIFDKINSVKEMVLLARKGTTRMISDSEIGSGVYILPQVVMSNHHVSEHSPPSFFTGVEFDRNQLREERIIFTGSWMQKRVGMSLLWQTLQEFQMLTKEYQDPISSAVGNFGYLDIAIHKLTGEETHEWPKVLFIPCPSVLQVGDDVFTTHFPGVEGTNFSDTISQHTEYRQWAPHDEMARNVFHHFGNLCVSGGKVVTPYTETIQNGKTEWIPHDDFQFTETSSHFILTNESVMNRSSGGCLQSNQCKTIQVGDYTLVEFHGIHFGGEFIKCQHCLKNIKQYLKENIEWSRWNAEINKWGFCKCESPIGLAYNYSISVHHPLFKQVYRKLILEDLLKLLNVSIEDERLARLKEYLEFVL